MLELWDETRSLERRLDDLLRAFITPRSSALTFPKEVRPFLPAIDVFAKDGDLVIRVELAGVDPEKDVTITLEKGQLILHGERKQTEEVKEEDYYRAEASYGVFERRIPIPEGIGEKDVIADYEDGILEVTVKGATKIEAPEARTIPVRSVKGGTKTEAA